MLRKKYLIMIVLTVVFMMSLMSCKTGTTVVENITDSETVVDSEWSAKDLKRVASEISDSVEKSKFIKNSKAKEKRWMLVKELRNDTDEHINTRVIVEKVRTQLVNRELAKFIDDDAVDSAIKQLDFQQSALFDDRKAAQVGNFVGAKMILRGRISSIRKRSAEQDIIYYNITLQAVNLETLEIVWTDESEIQRKTVKEGYR